MWVSSFQCRPEHRLIQIFVIKFLLISKDVHVATNFLEGIQTHQRHCNRQKGEFQRRHPSMSKSQLLKQLGWPTLAWRRRRAKLIYFWKLVNNKGPPCLSSRIPKSVNNRCKYSLRNTGTVELPACSSSLDLTSFIPSSCLLWKSLPPDVSSSSSVSSFTLMLPIFLLIVLPLVLVSLS